MVETAFAAQVSSSMGLLFSFRMGHSMSGQKRVSNVSSEA
jgi:hypothetical protein